MYFKSENLLETLCLKFMSIQTEKYPKENGNQRGAWRKVPKENGDHPGAWGWCRNNPN
jgi:hypothetical protein